MDSSNKTVPAAQNLDELATNLRRLRHESGGLSYAEIAVRISEARETQGMSSEQARMPKSSVYDVFRPGRKRINAALLAEIILAMGGTAEEADAWKRQAVNILENSKEFPSPQAHTQHQQNLAALLTVTLCVASVGINHALNFSVTALGLPLYLDMVGTAFASFAFGPLAGATVGVATNLVGNVMNGDFSGWWFMFVQIVGAVLWGYGFRLWFGRGPVRFLSLNVLVAVASTCVAVPIIIFAFGGVEQLHGTASIAGTIQQLGTGLVGAVFSANMLASLVDKLISGYLSLGALCLLSKYGFYVFRHRRSAVEKHHPVTRFIYLMRCLASLPSVMLSDERIVRNDR